MKFSIITPTHSKENMPFLLELYESIKSQSYEVWEWVISVNNGINVRDIPAEIVDDYRVLFVEDDSGNTNIGYIKSTAFHRAQGDILVEVDHDDLLMPNCLEELEKDFQDPEVGFVYSNSITYDMTHTRVPHSPAFGWEYTTINWRGEERYSMHHWQPTSHSLCYIWFAPDHVRAWRASVYYKIGGHNKNLSVCDDHELCIRTYLSTKMKLNPKPLYVYRVTGENTWLERNELIQKTTVKLFDEYARELAEKDAEGFLKIDLGGGLNPYKGYETVDIRETADYVGDLNDGIPLPDNSVGVINASHIIEHLKDPIKTMSEIHRVLIPGGWAFIEVPSTDGRGAWQDPTHVSFWNENSFLYYTHKEQADFIDNTSIRFQEMRKMTYFPNKWHQDLKIPITRAVLVALKDDSPRYPGRVHI